MAIYLNYQDIQGSVTAEGYKGMIALRHFKFHVSRKQNMTTGDTANRNASNPKFSTIRIEKRFDASSIDLYRASLTGSAGKQATFHFINIDADKLTEYITYTLENCILSKYKVYDTETCSHPYEVIHLSYTSILLSHKTRAANNQITSILRHGYDLEKAKYI